MAEIQLTEADILARLSQAANNAKINITFHVKLFFLRLLKIAQQDEGGYYINKTVAEIANAVEMPTRTVSYCLKQLSNCGVLYTDGRNKPQSRRINADVIGPGHEGRGLLKSNKNNIGAITK